YERKVNFSNQWVADTDENWIEIDQAKFTADNTARVEYRLDYAGGEENGQFYLRNCGFFDAYTAIGELFKRPKANQKPAIDFNERKVNFSNQWVADTDENWIEIDQAKFTADNTARVEYRLDYAGGEENGQFYLRNCGFFDAYTAIGELFKRPKANQKPAIDFN